MAAEQPKSTMPSKDGLFQCQFCHENLDSLTLESRQLHYEQHFEGLTQTSRHVGPSFPPPSIGTKTWVSNLPFKENDVFWRPSQADPPPSSFTPGIIPVLKTSLLMSHARGELRKAALCYDRAVHVQKEVWDATWGCGYRNFLMACSVLMDQPFQPLYFPLLDAPISPGIRNLQQWIEDAWRAGFDVEGRNELKKLVGTRKWIGTSDLWVAFSYRGIPAELVEFDLRNQDAQVQVVIDWVVNYFTPKPSPTSQLSMYDSLKGATPVISTDLMPIILQHDGHSRTIVGYEVDKHGIINLLAFDPGVYLPKFVRRLAMSHPPLPCDGKKHGINAPNRLLHSCNTKSTRSLPSDDINIMDHAHTTEDHDEALSTSLQNANTKTPGAKKLNISSNLTDNKTRKEEFRSVVQKFRLSPKKLGKKQRYQILYFPMTDPLTESERFERTVVKSTEIW